MNAWKNKLIYSRKHNVHTLLFKNVINVHGFTKTDKAQKMMLILISMLLELEMIVMKKILRERAQMTTIKTYLIQEEEWEMVTIVLLDWTLRTLLMRISNSPNDSTLDKPSYKTKENENKSVAFLLPKKTHTNKKLLIATMRTGDACRCFQRCKKFQYMNQFIHIT